MFNKIENFVGLKSIESWYNNQSNEKNLEFSNNSQTLLNHKNHLYRFAKKS
jgi:hypothetical protein